MHGYELGQAIFTPEDIERVDLIEDDRPYAGWLYFNLGIGSIYHDRGDRDRSNALMLTIGIVGPSSLAEESQSAVHEIVDATDPRGWDNQLEDELGLNATYLEKRRRIFDFDERYQTELGGHYSLTLGNVYSYAAAGLTWRYGTRLKGDIGPPSILPGFPGAPAFNPNQKSNWYLFGGIELRAMARNEPNPTALATLAQPPLRVAPDDRIASVLARMQRDGSRFTIVIDPQTDTTAGILTIEDIVAELVGEIEDPY